MDEKGESYIGAAQTCLGRMPLVSPTIDVMYVANDDPQYPEIYGQVKSHLADDEQSIINAINLDGYKKHIYLKPNLLH